MWTVQDSEGRILWHFGGSQRMALQYAEQVRRDRGVEADAVRRVPVSEYILRIRQGAD
jgi:hypothetical protein